MLPDTRHGRSLRAQQTHRGLVVGGAYPLQKGREIRIHQDATGEERQQLSFTGGAPSLSSARGGRVDERRDRDGGHHDHQDGQCVVGLADGEAVAGRNE